MNDENIVTSLIASYGNARQEEKIEIVAFVFFTFFLEDSKCKYKDENLKKIISLNLHDSYKRIGCVYFDNYVEFSDFLQNRADIFMSNIENLPKQLSINMSNSLFHRKPIIINKKNMMDGIACCSMAMEMRNAEFMKSWIMASKYFSSSKEHHLHEDDDIQDKKDPYDIALMIIFSITIVLLLAVIYYLS